MTENANRESLHRLVDLALNDLSFSPQMKKSLIKDYILWKWTAGFNEETKFVGCRFWSKRAYEQWKLTRRKFNSGKLYKGKTNGLRHDHVIPRAFIFEKLKNIAGDKIFETLEHFSIGCVLTIEENQHLEDSGFRDKMPGRIKDIWDRYRAAFADEGIEVVEISWPDAEVVQTILDLPQKES
jgi:hypothetical protein